MRLTLRISDKLHEKVKEAANESKRSLNGEIEYRLSESMKGGEEHGQSRHQSDEAPTADVQVGVGDASKKTREVVVPVASKSIQKRIAAQSGGKAVAVEATAEAIRPSPPTGSPWSLAGWKYYTEKYRREPIAADWDLYQKGKV